MADFLLSLPIVLRDEGGYVNNPKDDGGETYKGIARKFQGTWGGWTFIDSMKDQPGFPAALEHVDSLQAKVQQFYKAYWDQMLLSAVSSQPVANMIYDMSFPIGIGGISLLLQKSLSACGCSLVVDGIIGMNTLRSLNVVHPDDFIQEFGRQCSNHFYHRAMLESNDRAFLKGWLNRLDRHVKVTQ